MDLCPGCCSSRDNQGVSDISAKEKSVHNEEPPVVPDISDGGQVEDQQQDELRTPPFVWTLGRRSLGVSHYYDLEDSPLTLLDNLFAHPPPGIRSVPFSAGNAPSITRKQLHYHRAIAIANEAFEDAVYHEFGHSVKVIALGFLDGFNFGVPLLECIYVALINKIFAAICGPDIEARAKRAMCKTSANFNLEPLKVKCLCTKTEENLMRERAELGGWTCFKYGRVVNGLSQEVRMGARNTLSDSSMQGQSTKRDVE